MGAGNSPACAGRYGLAFVRSLRTRLDGSCPLTRVNCWWTGMQDLGYNPDLGHGYVLLDSEGKPSVRLFVHVDDFLIHAQTRTGCEHALDTFLNMALDMGLLCHPAKLKPPSQRQKYTGFIFDTRGRPTLRVPRDKRERALSMVQYLCGSPVQRTVSRLVLAVIAGTLESLTEATPSRLGHTYLRSLYDLIHADGEPSGEEKYYTKTLLSATCVRDLRWWERILSLDMSRVAHPSRSGILIPTFGDGSGTGTGGTIQLPSGAFDVWMGKWSPYVHSHSSNWKELKTLLITLQLLTANHMEAVKDTTLFYFTDNEVTYYISAAGSSSSPGLHALIEQIRHYELRLECRLQVIHVPGLVMIQQGTDGLSRGIWMSDLHPEVDQSQLTASIFQPAKVQYSLVEHYLSLIKPARLGWAYSPWEEPLRGEALLNRFTVHLPPPELARQTIVFFLEAWVEGPLEAGALFLVPRVVPAFWRNLSRHVIELDLIPAKHLDPPPFLPIPVIVLAVLPFSRSLSTNRRLDVHRVPAKTRRKHLEEVEQLRGLPPVNCAISN